MAAISVDPPPISRELAERLGLGFPVISDPDLTATRAYGLEDAENGIAWPAIFVIDREGLVRWRSIQENYKVREGAAAVIEAIPSESR